MTGPLEIFKKKIVYLEKAEVLVRERTLDAGHIITEPKSHKKLQKMERLVEIQSARRILTGIID